MTRRRWNRNGLRMAAEPPKPSAARVQFPFAMPEVQACIRAGDLNGLLRLRDKLTSAMTLAAQREVGFGESDRDELHLLQDTIKAGVAEVTVTLADGPQHRWGGLQERPPSRLQGGVDESLPERVKRAREALDASAVIQTGDTDERKAERDALPLDERLKRARRSIGEDDA